MSQQLWKFNQQYFKPNKCNEWTGQATSAPKFSAI